MELPSEFLTRESILTFTGATMAIDVLCAAGRKLLGIHSVWIPFALGEILAFVIAWRDGNLTDPLDWFVALINGVILFFAAVGMNEYTAYVKHKGKGAQMKELVSKRVWIRSWFAG